MTKKPKKIKGHVDQLSLQDFREGEGRFAHTSLLSDVLWNPDLLSEEQSLWENRAEENEEVLERVEKIKCVLHRLTPMEKKVIQLLTNRHTHQEVAQMLKISDGNVYTILSRAQKKIKKLVG